MRQTRHHDVILNLPNHRFDMRFQELFDDGLHIMGSAVVPNFHRNIMIAPESYQGTSTMPSCKPQNVVHGTLGSQAPRSERQGAGLGWVRHPHQRTGWRRLSGNTVVSIQALFLGFFLPPLRFCLRSCRTVKRVNGCRRLAHKDAPVAVSCRVGTWWQRSDPARGIARLPRAPLLPCFQEQRQGKYPAPESSLLQ